MNDTDAAQSTASTASKHADTAATEDDKEHATTNDALEVAQNVGNASVRYKTHTFIIDTDATQAQARKRAQSAAKTADMKLDTDLKAVAELQKTVRNESISQESYLCLYPSSY